MKKNLRLQFQKQCLIGYDCQNECWTDNFDDDFKVSMTPEGGIEDDLTFNSQTDFWG